MIELIRTNDAVIISFVESLMRDAGIGCFVASSPLLLSPNGSANRSCDLHSSSGVFDSLRINAFDRSRCLPAHLTISPDCLSLPAAVSISSAGCGSPFLARYHSVG